MAKSFDVFLSHNSKDKPAVRELAKALRARGLRVWLDEWELVPGRPWQEALGRVIETAGASAILIGKDGIGPWQDAEIQGCLSEFANRQIPVIPVLLPDAPAPPHLPTLLGRFTWVDLREGLTEEGLDRLAWGVTGSRPDRSNTSSATSGAEMVTAEGLPEATEVRPVSIIELDGAGTNGEVNLGAPTRRYYPGGLSIWSLGIILALIIGTYGYLYVNHAGRGDKASGQLETSGSSEGRDGRRSVDWLFLIDTSRSMAKIFSEVKGSLKAFVRTAERGDSIAMYTFDSKVAPGQSILLFDENDKMRLLGQINGLEPRGLFTHTGEALNSALARQEEMHPPGSESDRVGVIVLFTNGLEDTRDNPKAIRVEDIQSQLAKMRNYSFFVWLGKDAQGFKGSSLSTVASNFNGKAMVLQYPEARNIDGLKGELQGVAAKEARIVPPKH
ncbi:MAG TPA: TIR domain-containing protein [Thermoanaerobaculia bacterium]|jgi:Mg-chelatase subunit ChlD|nr:TIR domain-containing protein [Thermoanaerobaculia bacterium]